VLLDKHDPSKVLARASEPLLRPEPGEREGYVPNVVYTCGAMAHNDHIILPTRYRNSYSTSHDERFRADAGDDLTPKPPGTTC